MQEQSTSTLTLIQALGFTPDDLKVNRTGQMSELQHFNLRVQRRRAIASGMGILFIVILIASVLIFIGQKQDSLILKIVGIGITICNAALAGIFFRYWMRLSADINAKEARIISGTLERIIKPVNRHVLNYMIRVSNIEVIISEEAFEVFIHQEKYILYRAPYTGVLLSAEKAEA